MWSTAATCGGGQFSRSTDGGVTWMNPINIPNSPVWGTLDVDTNGNLFIGGTNFGSQFWCIRSSNAKNGGVTPTFDQSTAVNLGGSIDFGDTINPDGLVGQLFLAVDRSGTSTNNNIYMMASVQPTGFTTGTDVMFVRSTRRRTNLQRPAPNQRRSDQSQQMALVRHACRSRPMDASTPSGWTRATPRTTPIRSSSILTAPTAALHGRLTSR